MTQEQRELIELQARHIETLAAISKTLESMARSLEKLANPAAICGPGETITPADWPATIGWITPGLRESGPA